MVLEVFKIQVVKGESFLEKENELLKNRLAKYGTSKSSNNSSIPLPSKDENRPRCKVRKKRIKNILPYLFLVSINGADPGNTKKWAGINLFNRWAKELLMLVIHGKNTKKTGSRGIINIQMFYQMNFKSTNELLFY